MPLAYSEFTLDNVMKSCDPEYDMGYAVGYEFKNATHYMNNSDCELIITEETESIMADPGCTNNTELVDGICQIVITDRAGDDPLYLWLIAPAIIIMILLLVIIYLVIKKRRNK